MGKANSLPRFVLQPRAPEKIENSLMVLWVDTPAIVGDFEDHIAELGTAPHGNVTGDTGPEVLECIVDQI